MRQLRLALACTAMLAAPLAAQRAVAFEGGVLAQYTKFDDFTKLKSAVGLGGHFDIYILRRLALEYEENPKNPVPDIEICLENVQKAIAKLG